MLGKMTKLLQLKSVVCMWSKIAATEEYIYFAKAASQNCFSTGTYKLTHYKKTNNVKKIFLFFFNNFNFQSIRGWRSLHIVYATFLSHEDTVFDAALAKSIVMLQHHSNTKQKLCLKSKLLYI